jgi:hypothetical protein
MNVSVRPKNTSILPSRARIGKHIPGNSCKCETCGQVAVWVGEAWICWPLLAGSLLLVNFVISQTEYPSCDEMTAREMKRQIEMTSF